jgi:N-dimethylarginine dimethylaminohydrolase
MSKLQEASTFGGTGWVPRVASHRDDVEGGVLWHPCGVFDEVSPLREVLLSWPSERFAQPGDSDAALMLSWPDLGQLRRETSALKVFFEAQGVVVHLHKPVTPPPLNYLFMRDLVFITPEGAILARPASPVRAAEPRVAAQALAQMGVPILGVPTGSATFEGADALWLDAQTLLIGLGLRTNAAGAAAVAAILAPCGVQVLTVPVPAGAQHLLGVVVPISADRAIVDADRCSPALRQVLADRGVDTIEIPPSDENRRRRGMNIVVLRPNTVLMPAGCPELRARFEDHGLTVHALAVDAHVQAAGALGCMTAIIRRDMPTVG